jgi:hypothetical protein
LQQQPYRTCPQRYAAATDSATIYRSSGEHTMAMPISPVSNYNSYAPKTNSTNRQTPPSTPAATSPEADPPINQGGTLGSMINTKA